jgi:hypothetical protein
MKRCGICDYTAELGSPLLNKSPSPINTVRWDNEYKGFLCTDCSHSIQKSLIDNQIAAYEASKSPPNESDY